MRRPTLDTVWIALPLFGVVIAASVEPLPPYDFWWHLVMGRLLAAGTFPTENYFLYTMATDASFHDQPWLAQWLMYRVHALGGVVAGTVLQSILLLGTWLLLTWGCVRRGGARIGGALALAAVVVSFPVLSYRTRIFAFLPFVALLLILLDDRRRWWGVALIGILSAYWANVHGSFVLAPVLTFGCAGAAILEHLASRVADGVNRLHLRWWGGAFAAASIGSLASPHGWSNLAYVADLAVTSNVSGTVSEWLPPDFATGIGLVWGVAFLAALLVMLRARGELRIVEAALFLATTYLAASAVRSVFWWAAAAALVLAPHARAWVDDVIRRWTSESAEGDEGSLVNALLIALFALSAVAIHPATAPAAARDALVSGRFLRGGGGVLSHENAVAEVAAALSAAGDRQIFHDQALGGLVEWQGTSAEAPRRVAFVDQRMELIPESVWRLYFETSAGEGWRETFETFGVTSAVVSPETQWGLIAELDAAPDWELVRVGHGHLVYRSLESSAPASLDRAEDPAEKAGGEPEEEEIDTE